MRGAGAPAARLLVKRGSAGCALGRPGACDAYSYPHAYGYSYPNASKEMGGDATGQAAGSTEEPAALLLRGRHRSRVVTSCDASARLAPSRTRLTALPLPRAARSPPTLAGIKQMHTMRRPHAACVLVVLALAGMALPSHAAAVHQEDIDVSNSAKLDKGDSFYGMDVYTVETEHTHSPPPLPPSPLTPSPPPVGSQAVSDEVGLRAAVANTSISEVVVTEDVLLTGGQLTVPSGRVLTLRGACGPANVSPCMLDANSTSRHLHVTPGADVRISNFHLVNGSAVSQECTGTPGAGCNPIYYGYGIKFGSFYNFPNLLESLGYPAFGDVVSPRSLYTFSPTACNSSKSGSWPPSLLRRACPRPQLCFDHVLSCSLFRCTAVVVLRAQLCFLASPVFCLHSCVSPLSSLRRHYVLLTSVPWPP